MTPDRFVGTTHSFTIRSLSGYDEYETCARLQELVWGDRYVGFCSPVLQWVSLSLGGVCAGAFDHGGNLIGFVMGITGARAGEITHWSHMLAVDPNHRNKGIAFSLKLFQREQLLSQGVRHVLSSFDPLNSAQANILLKRLGAQAPYYRTDFYPTSLSPLHNALGTDRLLCVWDLLSFPTHIRNPEYVASEKPYVVPDWFSAPQINHVELRSFPDSGDEAITGQKAQGLPFSWEPVLSLNAPILRLDIPYNIVELQTTMPERAWDWRLKTRAAFESYFAKGYRAISLWPHPPFSTYILTDSSSYFSEIVAGSLDNI